MQRVDFNLVYSELSITFDEIINGDMRGQW